MTAVEVAKMLATDLANDGGLSQRLLVLTVSVAHAVCRHGVYVIFNDLCGKSDET